MVAISNLTTAAGDSWSRSLAFTSSGVAVNITGWTIWFTIKASPEDLDAAAIYQQKVTTHSNPTGGISAVSMTAAVTAPLLGLYYYDMQYKKSDGTIGTFLRGTINFEKQITISTT